MAGKAGGGSEVAVVATAHLGRGRVVAFAHDGYFGDETLKVADTAKLLWNAIRWAGADKPKPRVGLIDGPACGRSSRSMVRQRSGRILRPTPEGSTFWCWRLIVSLPARRSGSAPSWNQAVACSRRRPGGAGSKGARNRWRNSPGTCSWPGRAWPGPTVSPSEPHPTVIERAERFPRT